MGQLPALTFRGALRILGRHDHTTLDKLDTLLGGAILAAGALALFGPAAVPAVALASIWGWLGQKNEAIKLLRKLLGQVADRRLGLVGYERSQLIAAAHTVLAASAVMDAFRDLVGAETFKHLNITRDEQQALVSGVAGRQNQRLVDTLYNVEVPMPSAGRGFQENVRAVGKWQETFATSLLRFCSGVEAGKHVRVDGRRLFAMSIDRYVKRYHELASEVPEFKVWAMLTEHAATRTEIRAMRDLQHDIQTTLTDQTEAMARLEALLTRIAGGTAAQQRDVLDIVRRVNLAVLDEPIIPHESTELSYLRDIRFPSIREIYAQPRYRCDSVTSGSFIADEHWWTTLPVFDNLDVRLAAHLATPEAVRLPLLLLGHPGAGKSLLTKVLAARLPTSSFTPVHVPLRRVPADAPVYVQIEQALSQATHGRVDWATLTDQSDRTLRVVLLDGLDELLQAAGRDRTAYLHEVVDFQRRELDMSRPVVVFVTSRTIVADRVDVPTGLTVVKLEDFSDEQIESWRQTWNEVNHEAIISDAIRELSARATRSHPGLARQPLLLLMLALYAADPTSTPIETGVSRTTLYRMLLENFAARESAKAEDSDEAMSAPEQLRKLSVAALAMFNRGRQHVTDGELGADLAALAPQEALPISLAEAGQQVIGHFFFVYCAQAVVGPERTQRSYEFLHATFGEYLVAREVVDTLRDTAQSAVSRRGTKDPDDDLLFAQLSHHCLATRGPVLTFAADIIEELAADERAQIVLTLNLLIKSSRCRHGSDRYTQYRPTRLDRVRETAAYSANLVLLLILVNGGVQLSELLGEDYGTLWRSTLDLWRAGLDTDGWYALLSTFEQGGGTIRIQRGQYGFTALAAEVLRADLAGDRELALSLRMGIDVRLCDGYPVLLRGEEDEGDKEHEEDEGKEGGEGDRWPQGPDAVEQLLRWLIPLLALGEEPPDMPMHWEWLRALLAQVDPNNGGLCSMLAMLVKQRAGALAPEILNELVLFFLDSGDDPYALVAAIVARPRLLLDHPKLRDPDLYVGMQGALLMFEAIDAKSTSLSRLITAVKQRRRELSSHEDRLGTLAAALLDAYQWR